MRQQCLGAAWASTVLVALTCGAARMAWAQILSPCGSTLAHYGPGGSAKVDPEVAVGPLNIMTITNPAANSVNDGVAFWSKCPGVPIGGCSPLACPLNDFFPFTPGPGQERGLFDPEVHYDPIGGRFWAVCVEIFKENFLVVGTYFNLGMSQTSDPSNPTSWHMYRVQVGGAFSFIDQPNMAVDEAAVYIVLNTLSTQAGQQLWIYDKSAVGGTTLPPAQVLSLNEQTIWVANPLRHSTLSGQPHLLVGVESVPFPQQSTALKLYAVLDPLGSPTLASVSVGVPQSYSGFEGLIPQPGGSFGTCSGCMLASAVETQNTLWLVHTAHNGSSSDPRLVLRWYRIRLNGWPGSGQQPAVSASGTIDPGSPRHAYDPSLAVDPAGNMAIAFGRAGPSDYASMWAQVRCASGVMNPPVQLRAGIMNPAPLTFLGDYSGIDHDGTDKFVAHVAMVPSSVGPLRDWESWLARFDGGCAPDGLGVASSPVTDAAVFMQSLVSGSAEADMDGDGRVDAADAARFFEALSLRCSGSSGEESGGEP